MRLNTIEEMLLRKEFEKDQDYRADYDQVYLSKTGGEVIFIYDDTDFSGISEEENDFNKALIQENPEEYVEVTGLSHADHHDILKDFLASDWTDDEQLKQTVEGFYYGPNSIGFWKKQLFASIDSAQEIWDEYLGFRNERANLLFKKFMEKYGYETED